MDITKVTSVLQSPRYASTLKYGGFALIALILFGAGLVIGHRSAEFEYQWDSHYSNAFGGPQSPFGGASDDRPNMPHGAFGSVIGVNFPSFAIKGPHEAERIVIIGTTTAIHFLHESTTTSAIRIGSSVIVIGEPDDQGKIDATLIRIMPTPPSAPTSTQNTLTK
jgi:hypothetical protein